MSFLGSTIVWLRQKTNFKTSASDPPPPRDKASSKEPDSTKHNMDETAPRTLHGLKVLLNPSYLLCILLDVY